ncbi:MAG: DUF45 domain-containing protein [Clostridia bacterium]|nr:DUF45 domain-containing protein [Clostridia bacterium]
MASEHKGQQRQRAKRNKRASCTQHGCYMLDGKEVPYVLHFKSVKNYNLRVGAEDGFSVSVPHGTSEARVRRFLIEHEDFLRRALSRKATKVRACDRALHEQCLEDGTVLPILAGTVHLRIRPDSTKAAGRANAALMRTICEDGGEAWTVYLKENLAPEVARKAMEKAVISEEMTILQRLVEDVFPSVSACVIRAAVQLCGISEEIRKPNREYPYMRYVTDPIAIRFRDMKSRWGSCAVQKGTVTLNQRLIFTSKDCVMYVLCHELCHFIFADHSAKFHALLNCAMPDAERLRAVLNGNSSTDAF